MGKFRSKLKGQPKGKRWAKGQSSSSNPETKKYREQAKSRFFLQNLGPSNLTSDALRKHDTINTYVTPKLSSEPSEMDLESESDGTSFRTMQTFASDWSECSNASFGRLLKVFRSDSILHKEMLAILAAVTEVIKQNGGTESSTEYYAALMTTLEVTETEESLCAILSLLNMGLNSVPETVLRLKFSETSKIFIDLLNKNVDSDNNVILKSLMGILSHLLRVQELAAWNDSSIMQIFSTVLAFSCHSKPKIRKAAQQGICNILKYSSFMNNQETKPSSHHPAASSVALFCQQQLESGAGQTTILHTLTFLKDVIHCFPKTQMKNTCETILKLMTINNPLINSCGMQVLHCLFSSQTCTMNSTLNGQLISALYEYQPSVSDIQPTLAWIAVMQQAHVHLSDVDVMASSMALPKIVTTLTQLWLSERAEVMTAATHALTVIFDDCMGPVCSTSDMSQKCEIILQKCIQALEECLSYQYNKAWHQVLHVIATMFKVGGKYCSHLLINCLKILTDLRDSYKFSYNNELEYAVGAAIKSMGPEKVLSIISLTRSETEINIDRSWLLPLLKENVRGSTLEYFTKGILPIAILCSKKSALLSEANDGIGAHTYELLYVQCWSLLTSFCDHPTDVIENFKNIAKILGTAISSKKELRLNVLSSLRKLIICAKETENEAELNELSKFAKNYIPILFNLYTTKPNGSDEEGQRLAVLDTTVLYLSISSPELQKQLFETALERFKTQLDEFNKESILDLLRVLVPYQSASDINLLYEECAKNFSKSFVNKKEQKKSYRLLEEICSSETEGCKQFVDKNRKAVQKMLLLSLEKTSVYSKRARLRCLNCLVRAQPQLDHESRLLRSVVPEAIMACKDINEKCRMAAYTLLNSVGETLQARGQINQFTSMIATGLSGEPNLVNCSILALASVIHHFSGSLGQENLKIMLEMVCELMSSVTREIVAACLSFLKVYITSLPTPMVAVSLPVFVKSLTNMTEDCKRHFRLKVRNMLDRLIRKYGCDSISTLVPSSDTIMHKRLKNLRKLNARKKKRREEEHKQDYEENDEFVVHAKPRSMEEILADSDSDNEDERPTVRKSNTWIREDADDILDFTEPSATAKVTTTMPKPTAAFARIEKKKDHGFKTSSDGRLIITDDNSDTETKGKITFGSISDDDDDDGKSKAETAVIGDSKKRKRSDTESVRTFQSKMSYKAGGSGIHRPIKKTPSVIGAEYKSRKAAGDIKKKGAVDPYAYLPLVRTALNRRKKMKHKGQFKSIVKASQKGAKTGKKLRKK